MNTQTLGIGGAMLHFTSRRMREIMGILWFSLGIFTFCSLLSYQSRRLALQK